MHETTNEKRTSGVEKAESWLQEKHYIDHKGSIEFGRTPGESNAQICRYVGILAAHYGDAAVLERLSENLYRWADRLPDFLPTWQKADPIAHRGAKLILKRFQSGPPHPLL